jgi:hypothetical protein
LSVLGMHSIDAFCLFWPVVVLTQWNNPGVWSDPSGIEGCALNRVRAGCRPEPAS